MDLRRSIQITANTNGKSAWSSVCCVIVNPCLGFSSKLYNFVTADPSWDWQMMLCLFVGTWQDFYLSILATVQTTSTSSSQGPDPHPFPFYHLDTDKYCRLGRQGWRSGGHNLDPAGTFSKSPPVRSTCLSFAGQRVTSVRLKPLWSSRCAGWSNCYLVFPNRSLNQRSRTQG